MRIVHAVAAFTLLGGASFVPTLPAAAQNQRIIEIFGNDPCPSSGNDEIVVCRRLPEKDRFRIPERLRTTEPERGSNNTGVALAESTRQVSSQTLPNNCSSTGSMGHTGCFKRDADAARAERKQGNLDSITTKPSVVDE